MNNPTISFLHSQGGVPIILIDLKRRKKESIVIKISAMSKRDIHKFEITPSCAVSPPWIQYFSGVDRIDERAGQMKLDVFAALDIKGERFDKQATWEEYRKVASFLKVALAKLDRMRRI